MKKRKICAVITLIAFVLTMMPLMAFAASGSGSSIAVDDSSAKADGKDTLKYIVDLDEDLNKTQTGTTDQYVEVAAPATKTVLDGEYYTKDKDGNYVAVATGTEFDKNQTYYTKTENYVAITDMTGYISAEEDVDTTTATK